MQAFQEGYPDVTIFLTFGYSLPREEAGGDRAKLQKAHYGLLAPFLDGMVDAAKGKTRIVDGYELSYGYKDVARFAPAYQAMKTGVLPFVGADAERCLARGAKRIRLQRLRRADRRLRRHGLADVRDRVADA